MEASAAIVRRGFRALSRFFIISGYTMDPNTLYSVFPLILIFGVMYFLMIRPQQQRMKQHREMVANVRRGDTVVTAGGIVGKVVKAPQKDDQELTIEIADDIQVRVVRSTLSEVRARTQPVDTAKSDSKN
jgi:preprotein translocase subunit YajC